MKGGYANIVKLLKELDVLMEQIMVEAKIFKGERCPIAKRGEERHSFYSQLLNGIGQWGWKCPFCGKNFE